MYSKAGLSFPPPGPGPSPGGALAAVASHSHTWHQAPGRISLCEFPAEQSQGGQPGRKLRGFPSAIKAFLLVLPLRSEGSCGHPEGLSPQTAPPSVGPGLSFSGHVDTYRLGRACAQATERVSLPVFPGNEQGLNKVQLAL